MTQPTMIARNEYAYMLEELAAGRLTAAIPIDYQGEPGVLTQTFNPGNVDFTDEDAALYAAIVAIRSTYRTARRAGAFTRV